MPAISTNRLLGKFEYLQKGKVVQLAYDLAPAEVLEDSEQAALRAAAATKTSRSGKR